MINCRGIHILDSSKNGKGDIFCRLMGDLFHALGYDEPKYNIHKAGREIDLTCSHRVEKKVAIAECKAHKELIGGSDINKFVGVLDAERKKQIKQNHTNKEIVGFFVSLSGFTETAKEQEEDVGNDRLILLEYKQIVKELIAGKIIVPIARAVSCVHNIDPSLILADYVDLFAYSKGWVWVIYYYTGQIITHYALVHAEGNPLVNPLAREIISLDAKTIKHLSNLTLIPSSDTKLSSEEEIITTKQKYYKYLENECGDIHFEGLPTDKDAGMVKVKLENIFVPLHFLELGDKEVLPNAKLNRHSIGTMLSSQKRIALLARPGAGKSTLIKRLAIAYAYPERLPLVNDDLPKTNFFPIFIRCRELGDKVTESVTDIIRNIPNRAEIKSHSQSFNRLVSKSLQEGNTLLLIDGLDEITEEKFRILFVNQLRTFLATYPNISVVVTSREAGFRVVGGALAGYCTHYKISGLRNKEIVSLTRKWHTAIIDDSENTLKEANNISNIIIRDGKLNVLATNPLLLTTLLFVKRWAGYLPTKKNILYQEMIKLLLVTWNVEGHEQLDIDETEPQLAYIAFWMTTNGKQTITYKELKEGLYAARKQMPEILGFTKISVPDFIKQVEARSSLLIMSGHQLVDDEIIPVYEFLHLSFQEYLTAKAVVEKYLPEEISDKNTLTIIKPYIVKENWKEITPLVIVLSKRESKSLVEYFINSCKKAHDLSPMTVDYMNYDEEYDEYVYSELLGSCIVNEVQIIPSLLEEAIEWFIKTYSSSSILEIILNNKFKDIFIAKARDLVYGEYDDRYFTACSGLLSEINYYLLKQKGFTSKIDTIATELFADDIEVNISAVLTLLELVYQMKQETQRAYFTSHSQFDKIINRLIELLAYDDNRMLFSISWLCGWLGGRDVWILNAEQRLSFVTIFIDKWITITHVHLISFISWALVYAISPKTKIKLDHFGLDQIAVTIKTRIYITKDFYSTVIAIYLALSLDVGVDIDYFKTVVKEKHNTIENQELLSELLRLLDIDESELHQENAQLELPF